MKKLLLLLIVSMIIVGSTSTILYAADTAPPKVSASPSGGSIAPGSKISIFASDDQSGIAYFRYMWDDGDNPFVNGTSATITAPNSAGTHTLELFASDKTGSGYGGTGVANMTTGYFYYTVTAPDTTPPKVSVHPDNGIVAPGQKIFISAQDSSDIGNLAYKWDSGKAVNVYYPTAMMTATAPTSPGSHTLEVWAQDNSSSVNYTGWVSHSYTVTAADTTAPTVSSTNPTNNATGIAVNKATVVTFSESIKQGSNFNNIQLKNSAGTSISKTWYIDTTNTNKLYILQDAPLAENTKYTVTIPASAVTDNAGNNLVSQYTFSFTTRVSTPTLNTPTITGTGIYGSSAKVNVTGTNMEIASYRMFYTTSATAPAVSPTADYNSPGTGWIDSGKTGMMTVSGTTSATATIAGTDLNNTTWKHIVVKVAAASGDNMANAIFSQAFKLQAADTTAPTVRSTDPTNNATKIAVNKATVVTFSESIKQGSNFNNIQLNNSEGTSISKTWYIDTTNTNELYILQDAPLAENTKYTVTIPASAVTDNAENNLVSQYTFSFTTASVPVTGVSLSPTTSNLKVGENATLLASVAPDNATNKNLTWTTSNSGVVKLTSTDNSGAQISAVRAGTAVITAKTVDGRKTAVCTVTVTAVDTTAPTVRSTDPANNATKIAVNKATVVTFSESIKQGSNFNNIQLNNSEGTSISKTWYIDTTNTNKLYILQDAPLAESTKYTVIIPASAVTDNAGNNLVSQYTFSFTTASVPVTGVSLSPATSSLGVGENATLLASVAPDNATNKNLTWTTSNSSVVKLTSTDNSGAQISAVRAGTAVITVKTVDGRKTAVCKVTVAAADTTAPTVSSTDPANNAAKIAVNKAIVVTFSESIKQGSNFNNIQLNNSEGTSISKTWYIDTTNTNKLYILQDAPLAESTKYTVTIPASAVTDNAGNNFADQYTFSFTTKATTPLPTTTITFPDLPSNHWAYQAVDVMAQKGIINGYSDGTFRPNDMVTREQFAKMMVLSLNISIVEPELPTFKDVSKNHWAYKYVESAKSYLTGYQKADGLYYKGGKSAVREEMAYALVKAKGYDNLDVDLSRLNLIFNDTNAITEVLKKYVLIAYDKGIMRGNADGTFVPKGTLTRAEAAQLLYNVLMIDEDDSGKVIIN